MISEKNKRKHIDTEEFGNLRFQFGTSSRWGGRRYLPYAFTEQGIAIAAASPSAHRYTLGIENLEGLNNRSALRI